MKMLTDRRLHLLNFMILKELTIKPEQLECFTLGNGIEVFPHRHEDHSSLE